MHEIECKPSRWLGLLQAGMGMLALLAVWRAALPLVAQLVLSLGVAWLLWRTRQQPAYLRLRQDGSLQWRDQSGDWQDAEIGGDSLVNTWVMVVRLRVAERLRTLILLSDSAPPDALRRLRVFLRWAHRTHSDITSPGVG